MSGFSDTVVEDAPLDWLASLGEFLSKVVFDD